MVNSALSLEHFGASAPLFLAERWWLLCCIYCHSLLLTKCLQYIGGENFVSHFLFKSKRLELYSFSLSGNFHLWQFLSYILISSHRTYLFTSPYSKHSPKCFSWLRKLVSFLTPISSLCPTSNCCCCFIISKCHTQFPVICTWDLNDQNPTLISYLGSIPKKEQRPES